jgi:hypothetical protein
VFSSVISDAPAAVDIANLDSASLRKKKKKNRRKEKKRDYTEVGLVNCMPFKDGGLGSGHS